jgi:hypothetical protein
MRSGNRFFGRSAALSMAILSLNALGVERALNSNAKIAEELLQVPSRRAFRRYFPPKTGPESIYRKVSGGRDIWPRLRALRIADSVVMFLFLFIFLIRNIQYFRKTYKS